MLQICRNGIYSKKRSCLSSNYRSFMHKKKMNICAEISIFLCMIYLTSLFVGFFFGRASSILLRSRPYIRNPTTSIPLHFPSNSSLLCNMSSSIVQDYIHVFSDGTVSRFAPEIAPASTEESGRGFKSKDVVIDSLKAITGRVFLPDTPAGSSCCLIPILVYFHGGGFCIGSTTWIGYHRFLGDFSFLSRSIVLSIDYRLAPENRLPTAYEDCYASLEWLSCHAASEPWLSQADISRVFLSGDSAGGNIAHQVAVKALQCKLLSINIEGLMLIHPYFGSEKRTKKEEDAEKAFNVAMNDMFWKLSIPEGSDRDYYGCNFEKDERLGKIEWDAFPKVVVFVAGLDFLKERGVLYAEYMEKKMGEKKVKVVEAEEEEHVFHVFNPESEATRSLQQQMEEFMKKTD